MSEEQKKICKYCNNIYTKNMEECPRCQMPLQWYNGNSANNSGYSGETELWMIIISFLIPLVGIILGCIKVSQKDNDGAKKIFIATIVSIVLYYIIFRIL
ncbi:MAG: hypothetical protein K2H01_09915 [Ruminococcus sp.]|nr:hypothetical protein [Ruminococcus sp.]